VTRQAWEEEEAIGGNNMIITKGKAGNRKLRQAIKARTCAHWLLLLCAGARGPGVAARPTRRGGGKSAQGADLAVAAAAGGSADCAAQHASGAAATCMACSCGC
jgi:hypothetical protein